VLAPHGAFRLGPEPCNTNSNSKSGLSAAEAGSLWSGGLSSEGSSQYYRAMSDDYFDVCSDAYCDVMTP